MSLVEEVVGVLPRAGVAIALGRAQAKRSFDEVAAVELGLGAVGPADGRREESGWRSAGDPLCAMPPAMGTMREVEGVTSSMAVTARSREVVGVAEAVRSSHWSGSKSALVSESESVRGGRVRMRTTRAWTVRLRPSA